MKRILFLNKKPLKFFSGLKRGELREKLNLNIHDHVQQFELLDIKNYPEFDIDLYFLKHKKLGCNYYHFDTSDKNNSFGVVFRTLPTNSKGLPHILEHTVLCGSKKYPVKDPFFQMLQRSLNSYMNAWTGPDFTFYPFSTNNEQDYKNLLSVYLDSVFNSNLNINDFRQEGWRLENIDNKLKVSGVVFNEMKGVYESQDNIMMERQMRELFKGSEYSNDSGGQPLEILNLQYEEFLEFYKKYYHPSNCNFISYGDLDFRNHIQFLEDNYLKNYENSKFENYPKRPSIQSVQTLKIKGPKNNAAIKPNHDSQFSISYLIENILNKELDYIGLNLLNLLLFEYPGSPIYRDFLAKDLAGGYCAGYGFESSIEYPTFTFGFKGIKNDQQSIESLEQKLQQCLEELVEKKFDRELIESVLHTFEIKMKIGQQNNAIGIFEGFFNSFNYGNLKSFDQYFNLSKTIETLRQKVKDKDYFENLLKNYILNNNKKLKVILEPEDDFLLDLNQQEQRKLQQIQDNMTTEQMNEIKEQNEELKQYQEKVQDISILPKLKISDIPETIERYQMDQTKVNGVDVNWVRKNTKGLTHLRIKLDITGFPESLIQYLYMLQKFLNQVGTTELNYEEFVQQMGKFTNDINIANQSFMDYKGGIHKQNFILSVACLDKNIENTFNLLSQLLIKYNFKDFKRVSQLIKLEGMECSNALTQQAFPNSKNQCEASLSQAVHTINPYTNQKFLSNFSIEFSKGFLQKDMLEDIELHFNMIMNKMIKKNRISFLVHTNENNQSYIEKRIHILLKELESKYVSFSMLEEILNMNEYKSQYIKEYHAIPSQVNYVCESFQIPHYTHNDYAHLAVASQLLQHSFLHKLVREQGGAYGCMARLSGNRVFSFISYRDPNFLSTYLKYEEAVKNVAEGNFTQDDLDGAKMGLFSSIDQVPMVQNVGLNEFYFGLTQDMYQEQRLRALQSTKEEVQQVVNKYLYKSMQKGQTSQVIFGSKDNNLEGLVSRGWVIEKFSDKLTYK